MEGVTTAIVLFIFACLIWPSWVKSKPQFYAAMWMVLIIILFDAIGHMASDGALPRVMYVLAALLQMLAILLLVLCVGGLSVREFGFEMQETIQAIRQGGDDKPVLVPLRGEQPKPRKEVDTPPQRINLTPDTPPRHDDTGPLPLD